jgi:hypothetical protein
MAYRMADPDYYKDRSGTLMIKSLRETSLDARVGEQNVGGRGSRTRFCAPVEYIQFLKIHQCCRW